MSVLAMAFALQTITSRYATKKAKAMPSERNHADVDFYRSFETSLPEHFFIVCRLQAWDPHCPKLKELGEVQIHPGTSYDPRSSYRVSLVVPLASANQNK